MSSSLESFCIIGASLAGIRAAQVLRRDGFGGKIVLVGAETHRPYDRPPLSKESLKFAENQPMPLELVKPDDYAALELEEWLGWKAVKLNPKELSVEIQKEQAQEKIQADAILLATGVRARNIFADSSGKNLSGVYTLRTLDDCQAIWSEFVSDKNKTKKVVVVGAGFIGCEVAAAARSLGLEVCLIEMASQPLEQVLGKEVGELVAQIHKEKSVQLRLNTAVEGLTSLDGKLSGVELADGTLLEADVAIVGVGAIPNTEWLEGSGLTIENGVVCDQFCMAAPKIAAAGDMARWRNLRYGTQMRIEHWDNAIEQSKVATRNLLKSESIEMEEFSPIPWFWSDQYEHKIQLSGLCSPTDQFQIFEGSVEERKFVGKYIREGKVVGVLGLNSPRQVMQNRSLIENDFPLNS